MTASPAPLVRFCVTVTSLPLVVAVNPSPTKSILLTAVVRLVPSSLIVTLAATLLKPLPSPSNLPKDAVDVAEALTLPEAVTCCRFVISFPPKSKSCVAVWSPKLSEPPLPPAANDADVKYPPPTKILPKEPVFEPLILPDAVIC